MYRTTLAALSAALVLPASAGAHDFWLLPQAFEVEEPGEVPVRFAVGHAGDVNAWNLRWDRVAALRLHGEGQPVDLQPYLTPTRGMIPGQARVPLSAPGTHVVAFESNHSFSELEAAKFNDYAEEEGLTPILEARERAGQTEANGRELYSRRAKALIQVGGEATDDALRPLGHSLEIVPDANPYALGEDRTLGVRVLFRGAPLAGAKIDVSALGTGEAPYAKVVTDEEGRATFEVPEGGAYRINTVWGTPIPPGGAAEFETFFASLTFGG